jgi:hypothetical protein
MALLTRLLQRPNRSPCQAVFVLYPFSVLLQALAVLSGRTEGGALLSWIIMGGVVIAGILLHGSPIGWL